jgi:hypothetical protein
MSLGIFSFDLAAMIDSLSNFLDLAATSPDESRSSLDKTEEVLQNASVEAIDGALMAAINSANASVVSEILKKENLTEKTISNPAVRSLPVTLDEETRREIERLIKSLQTTVMHGYQSTDIIEETVACSNVVNFPRRKTSEDPENTEEFVERRKTETRKLEVLREELKRAMMKNNSEV